MEEAKKWLENNYENKKDNTTKINFEEGTKLDGELTIDSYLNLKEIDLGGAGGITELIIKNCPKVEAIFVSRNKITKIEGLTDLTNLQQLSFGNNKVEEIDISQNKQLELLHFAENPKNLKFANGIKDLSKLVFWNSNDTFAITTLLEQASGADLKEIAEKLSLNVGEKTPEPEEMKKLIGGEIDKLNQNKEKLNEVFSDLIDGENKVDDKKLKEIKNNVDKGKEYQELMNELVNAPIVDADKIDQTKLTDKLKKAANYEKLVENENNKELVTDDGNGKEIDQGKIDGLRTASGDVAAAMPILGVSDLKPDTLNTILGGSKLSDIPNSKTLKDVLESEKKLKDALNNIGINPDSADVKKEIAMLKGLEKKMKELYGDNYVAKLKIEEYQNQVEVNTNK